MFKSQFWKFVVAVSAVALFSTNAHSDGSDYSGPQTSGGNDTAHVPYTPPEKPAEPIMRAREPGDGAERPEGHEHEHDLEDVETERRSHGEGSGNNEESQEPPGD